MAKSKNPTPAGSDAPAKSKCPISRAQFMAKAPVLSIKLGNGDNPLGTYLAAPKNFSTNSFGWNVNEKTIIVIDGVPVKVQIGTNITVVGSKEAD